MGEILNPENQSDIKSSTWLKESLDRGGLQKEYHGKREGGAETEMT